MIATGGPQTRANPRLLLIEGLAVFFDIKADQFLRTAAAGGCRQESIPSAGGLAG